MNDIQFYMNQFDLNDSDLDYSFTFELLTLYKKICLKEIDMIEVKNLLEQISDTAFFPYDSEFDSYYALEQLYYNCMYSSPSELKTMFSIVFDVLKTLRKKEIHYSVNNQEVKEFNLKNIVLSIPNHSVANESFEEINILIKQSKYESINESIFKECEESFLNLLNTTTGLISRERIRNEVKHSSVVYQFLKPKYVLDFKGMYLDVREFNISNEIKEYMFEDLNYSLNENETIHIDDLYNEFYNTYYDYLTDNKIFTSYALFSILEYMFSNSFEFKRPYISIKGKYIYNRNAMIESFIINNPKLFINDLYSYLNRLKLSSAGFFNIMESMKNEICFENHQIILNWKLVQIDKGTIFEIEELIYEEVLKERAMAIVDLECAYWFPKLNIDWDEWFIYSLLEKYSSRLFVKPSSRQFRYATPIVSIENNIDDFELNYLSEYKKNQTISKKKDFDLDSIELENVKELLDMKEM